MNYIEDKLCEGVIFRQLAILLSGAGENRTPVQIGFRYTILYSLCYSLNCLTTIESTS